MDEINRLTPSYAGITYDRIGDMGLQWPCPTVEHPGTPILHVGKFSRGLGTSVPWTGSRPPRSRTRSIPSSSPPAACCITITPAP
jgi:hypothetical protein